MILSVSLAVLVLLLVVLAAGQYLLLDSLRFELEEYIEDCREVARIADDPRIKIHYTAVATVLSGMLSKLSGE